MLEVAGVHERGLHAEPRKLLAQELCGPAIEPIAGDNAVALLNVCEQPRCDRGHAGAAGHAPLGTFQRRELTGEVPSIRMAIAGVDVAGGFGIQNAVERVEVGQRVDRGLVERGDEGRRQA